MLFLNRFFPILVPLLFFIVSLFTIYDYGMNWDSPIHFARGQAYLRYILTGKTNYNGLPTYCMNEYNLISSVDYQTREVCNRHRKVRISEYESNLLDFNSWVAKAVYGHPAFSGLMLALSNNIFFKFLGWVEDVNAYHLYTIFSTFILALTVSIWTRQTFGIFASIIAVLTVYTFPLLAGEQHFNVKDPSMAAFFTLAIYLFYQALVKKNHRLLILSALAGGASFGTKFNFIFAPFVLLPWINLNLTVIRKFFSKKFLLVIILYPIIVFLVFFLSWPALWPDPITNIPQVFGYYKDIGNPSCNYSYFNYLRWIECSNLITVKNFIYTTPSISLFLFIVGFIASIFWYKKKDYLPLLLLTFFLVTLLRVTFPVSSIYGGLRQIMEFIAPMAIITGIGALFLKDNIVKMLLKIPRLKAMNKSIVIIISTLFILGYLPIAKELIKLHPNQNIYYNFLIGGLKGAAEKNFPGYGNTYGNAYLQGVKWLNLNAQPGAKLALVSGLGQNLSRGQLRADIDFSNGYRSGYNQEGEYLISLVEGNDPLTDTFRFKYTYFLNPLYDLKVDGVSLLRIWKNDKIYLKDGIDLESRLEKIKYVEVVNKEIVIQLDSIKHLKALTFAFPELRCKDAFIGAKVYASLEDKKYMQKAEGVNSFSDRETAGFNKDFVYLFPADRTQYIKIVPLANYPCNLSDIELEVFTLPKFTDLR